MQDKNYIIGEFSKFNHKKIEDIFAEDKAEVEEILQNLDKKRLTNNKQKE